MSKSVRNVIGAAILVISFTGNIPAGAEAEPIRLTLGETLRLVETENLDASIAREGIAQAFAAVDSERSRLMPEVSLDATQVRNQIVTIGRGFGVPGARQPPPANRFDAGVSATVPIVDPVAIANFRSARLGLDVSRQDYEENIQIVLDAAAEVYLTHLRNLRRFEVIEANIERGEALLDLARTQLDAGVATQIDVTRAEVQLAEDEQARLQQQTVVYQTELLLKRLLDLDLLRPIEIEDFTASRHIGEEGPEVDFDRALEDRPELRRVEAQLAQNRLERRAAGWERFPSIYGFGEYGYVNERAFQGSGEREWLAGITMSIPLFEGFRIQANRDLATSRIRASELRKRQLEQEVSSEILLAWQDMDSRLAQTEVAEQNVRLSEEELRLARVRFEQGVADNREVIDAQNRLAMANDNLVEAVHQFNLSRLEYARSKGDVRLLLADQEVR